MKLDIIMLGSIANTYEVGLYTAATKITELTYTLPVALSSTFFPLMVSSYNNIIEYENIFKRLQITLLFCSILLVVGIFIYSDYIIFILYGEEYYASGLILLIHSASIPFVYLSVLINNHLVISSHTKQVAVRVWFGALINILFNLSLIPRFGAIGAAIATFTAQALIILVDLTHYQSRRALLITFLGILNVRSEINQIISKKFP